MPDLVDRVIAKDSTLTTRDGILRIEPSGGPRAGTSTAIPMHAGGHYSPSFSTRKRRFLSPRRSTQNGK
jgi:hypothetical protein